MGLNKWYKQAKSNNFLFEIGSGRINGAYGVFKFGRNNAVVTTGSTIYDVPNLITPGPHKLTYLADNTEQTFTVESSSIIDSYILATGAKVVRIFGLTATGLWQVEDVRLNGTTPVNTVGKYWRIFRAYIVDSAVRVGAAGDIIIKYSGTIYVGIVYNSVIPNNQTQMAAFTIPLGYDAILIEAHLHSGAKALDFFFQRRDFGKCERAQRTADYILAANVHWDWAVPIKFDSLTDICINGTVSSPPGTSSSADFGLVLLKQNNDVADLSITSTIGEGS